jgi:hypothetical protein
MRVLTFVFLWKPSQVNLDVWHNELITIYYK